MKKNYRYGFIGAGNMVRAILTGLCQHIDPKQIIASTKTSASAERLVADFQISTTQNNADCLAADIIVLGIKPQQLGDLYPLFKQHQAQLADKVLISLLAGVSVETLQQALCIAPTQIVRAMPNLPAAILQGVTGLYSPSQNPTTKEVATQLLSTVGEVVWVESDTELNALSAISGSGPAYTYLFISALVRAGISLGLPSEVALLLAQKTVLGASQLVVLEQPNDITDLDAMIAKVTSKGGTTAEAMACFEKQGFVKTVDSAVYAANARANVLGSFIALGIQEVVQADESK